MTTPDAPRHHPLRPRGFRRWTAIGVIGLLAVAITASSNGFSIYHIKSGDTLSEIAARYHTTVDRLVQLNALPGNGNLIYAGDTLRIPGRSHHHRRHHHHHKARHHQHFRVSIYVVRPGDSLYAIADGQHASWRRIAWRNHLPSSHMVVIGQRLRIPHRVHGSSTQVASNGFPGTGGVNYEMFRGRHVPSRDQVAAMIRATSSRWGVDPRLALAISYMEAGFNQRMVSAYGAIGAMQVMPATGRSVGAYIVHRDLDLLNAQDNVTAGVALLSVLLRETHGDQARAAAGYYQGLASVQTRGMFRDTKRYVASVMALRNRF